MSSAEQTTVPPSMHRTGNGRSGLSPSDLAKALSTALEQDPGDGSQFRVALGEIAREQGMMKLSRQTGLAREALYRALSERGNPELATVLKVLKALGLQVAVKPRPARRRPA